MATQIIQNTADNAVGIIPVPTLSTLGFVTDSSNKFDKLLAHAFASDYNQTQLYPGNITSIANIIKQGGNDMGALITAITNGLQSYLGKYYTSVNVVVAIIPNAINVKSSAITFQTTITVGENLGQNTFDHNVVTEDGSLQNIINLNNYG